MSQTDPSLEVPFGCDCNKATPEEYIASAMSRLGKTPGLPDARVSNFVLNRMSVMTIGLTRFMLDMVNTGELDLSDADAVEAALNDAFKNFVAKHSLFNILTDNYFYSPPGVRETDIMPGDLMTVPEYTVYYPNICIMSDTTNDPPIIPGFPGVCLMNGIGTLFTYVNGVICYERLRGITIPTKMEFDYFSTMPCFSNSFSQVGELGEKSTTIQWNMKIPTNYTIELRLLGSDDMMYSRLDPYQVVHDGAKQAYNYIREQYGLTPIA